MTAARRRLQLLVGAAAGVASSCGGGTIANEDLPLGAILVILAVVVVAFLVVAFYGHDRDR